MPRGSVVSVRSLRLVLVAAVVVLLAVVAVFIGKARWFRPHFHFDAKKLGLDVSTDSEGVTLSNSALGVTQFTVHAARRIQYKDGRMSLFDVGIVLCGSKGDRADRIQGNQFDYDQKNGLLTAVGEVFIDLAPPAGKLAQAASTARHCDAGTQGDPARMIHMKTSGLVFQQKEQIARTDNPVDFQSGGMAGSSVGASYDAPNGVIDLHSQVRVSGLRGAGAAFGGAAGAANTRPMELTAAHAEIDMDDGKQPGNVAFLDSPHLVEAVEGGTQAAVALHAVVHMGTDGTPRLVTANGGVTLSGSRRGSVTSDKLELELHPGGQPGAAHLWGSVRFVNAAAGHRTKGQADDARIAFDALGKPVHAVLTSRVEADLDEAGGRRTLNADKLELALAGGGHDPVQVLGAQASGDGGARLRLLDAGTGKSAGSTLTTDVKADLLTARFSSNGTRTAVTGVDGAGHTVVDRAQVDGAGAQTWKETGTGDSLKLDFSAGPDGRQRLARAEQRGDVILVRETAAKVGARTAGGKAKTGAETEHAQGEDAVYDAATDRMTLNGQVKMSDANSALFADRVLFDRGTGDATADGSVRVSYVETGSAAEPMHVLAARAVAHKATGLTEFFGGAGAEARMWQGGSQVLAPVLAFDRGRRTLAARGTGEAQAVKTVLVESGSQAKSEPGSAKKLGSEAKRSQGPVRVLSRTMMYSDAARQVVFAGGVQVSGQDGTLRSQQATAYLEAKASAPAKNDAAMELGGRVDRIVCDGGVEIVQPGRRATGEKLVYTAADRTFVLTGGSTLAPKLVDDTQGTVTGASLRFRTGDDSVEVLSGEGQERVRTETRMKQKD